MSDREADASSVAPVLEWSPGRPAATKGLQINTVRPEWTLTTRLTAAPRNPTIVVSFDRTGRVVKAVFDGPGTGVSAVDEPLISAVYRFTAKGEALQKLPDSPNAHLTVRLRVTLRS